MGRDLKAETARADAAEAALAKERLRAEAAEATRDFYFETLLAIQRRISPTYGITSQFNPLYAFIDDAKMWRLNPDSYYVTPGLRREHERLEEVTGRISTEGVAHDA